MTWVLDNLDYIGREMLVHLATALPPIVLSFVISIPVGWMVGRFRWSRGTVLTVFALLYAIPSFPLFVVLPLLVGTGLRSPINVVIGLTMYGVALMARSTADGLDAVDSDVLDSATGMGFSTRSRFWRVELPLAGPVLLAGIRVVAVSTISLTTVGAVLGIDSLGTLFTDGFQRNIPEEILTGIVLTIVLAIVVDAALVLLGRAVMPWTRKESGTRHAGFPRRARRAATV